MPRKLLLITYAFPPMQAPESYLSAKALSALQGFDVEVLTINPAHLGLTLDRSMTSFVESHFKCVHYVTPPKWFGPELFRSLRYVMVLPDRFRIFNSSMLEAALKINVQAYDVVMSWSQWHSVHLVAAEVKRRFPEIRWVSHMSDPWADNPFLPRVPGFSYIQRLIEQRVIRMADSIHFTTVETQNLVMKNYPDEYFSKAHVLPHCYVSDLYKKRENGSQTRDQWVIRYLGNFYGPRNPKNLARALSLLQTKCPELLQGVRVEIVGRWIDNARWRPQDEGVVGEELFVFKQPVEYCKSLSLMSDADMLLILDAPFEQSIFFPSKLVDYIGAKRPILALTPEGSCAEILRKVGGLVASPSSVESIIDGLVMAIMKMKNGTAPEPEPSAILEYEAASVGRRYDILLGKLIDR